MRSGPEAVEVESLEIAVVNSLVVTGEQKVLWMDESEHWLERRSFMNHEKAGELVERSVSGGRKSRCWQGFWGIGS